MTKSQRKAVCRIIRYMKTGNDKKVTITYVDSMRDIGCGLISVTVRTKRIDCHKHSPRAVVAEKRLHAIIGKRGGIKVSTCYSGLTDMTEFAQKYLRR